MGTLHKPPEGRAAIAAGPAGDEARVAQACSGDRRGGVLEDGQREVFGQALADALIYRDPAGLCPGCEGHPAGLCDDHAADLLLTDAYLQLAAELGIEVER
jgi:hypothetical protein